MVQSITLFCDDHKTNSMAYVATRKRDCGTARTLVNEAGGKWPAKRMMKDKFTEKYPCRSSWSNRISRRSALRKNDNYRYRKDGCGNRIATTKVDSEILWEESRNNIDKGR